MVFIIENSWCCKLHRPCPTHCVGMVSWLGDLNGDTALCNTIVYHVTLVTTRDQAPIMLPSLITVSVLMRLTSQCSLSSSETQFEARECSSQHVKSALEETCSCVPRPVVVRLPWPNNTDVHHMTPTHVEVNTAAASSRQQEIGGVFRPQITCQFSMIWPRYEHVTTHVCSGLQVRRRMPVWSQLPLLCGQCVTTEVSVGDAGDLWSGTWAVCQAVCQHHGQWGHPVPVWLWPGDQDSVPAQLSTCLQTGDLPVPVQRHTGQTPLYRVPINFFGHSFTGV